MLGRAGGAPLVLGLALLWLLLVWTSLDHLTPDPPPLDPPPAGPPKISLFFFPFPPPFRCYPEMCTFGLSGCRVKPRRPHQTRQPGLAHDNPRTPNVHTSRPLRFKNTETAKRWREREEKARNFGPPTLRGPTLQGPTFSRFGPPTHWGSTLRGSLLGGAQRGGAPMGKNTETPKLAKVGLAKVGQHSKTLTKIDQSRFGPSWSLKNTKIGQSRSKSWPKSVWPKSVKTTIGQSRSKNWPKSVWPKSVNTKIGQSRFGQSRSTLKLAKVGLAKVGK